MGVVPAGPRGCRSCLPLVHRADLLADLDPPAPVLVDRRIVQGWDSTPIALQEWSAAELARAVAAGPAAGHAGFAVATMHVDTPADTFLALPGSSRGLVWVSGFLLGRYREIGPQATLYCPAPLLRAGENVVTVLELERLGAILELGTGPSWDRRRSTSRSSPKGSQF